MQPYYVLVVLLVSWSQRNWEPPRVFTVFENELQIDQSRGVLGTKDESNIFSFPILLFNSYI